MISIDGHAYAPGTLVSVTGPGRAALLARVAARPPLRPELVGYAPQPAAVFTTLTALENVALPLLAREVSRAEAWTRAAGQLSDLGLAAALHGNLAEQLSGGQRQRVAFARACVTGPALLLADEPAAELDPDTAGQLMTVVHRLTTAGAVALIATTSPIPGVAEQWTAA